MCPLCKKQISHKQLEAELKPIWALHKVLEEKSVARLKQEHLMKAPELMDKSSPFYNNPVAFGMDRYSFFSCYKCKKPYFAGQRSCQRGDITYNETELLCNPCTGNNLDGESCKVHGTEFIDFKCKFCCAIACWSCIVPATNKPARICDKCHGYCYSLAEKALKDVNLIPRCAGPEACPLKVTHPHCEEFALGCSMCRSVDT